MYPCGPPLPPAAQYPGLLAGAHPYLHPWPQALHLLFPVPCLDICVVIFLVPFLALHDLLCTAFPWPPSLNCGPWVPVLPIVLPCFILLSRTFHLLSYNLLTYHLPLPN